MDVDALEANVDAIPTQALPAAVDDNSPANLAKTIRTDTHKARVASRNRDASNSNTITCSGEHKETPGTDSAQTPSTSDQSSPQNTEAASNATQTFEAGGSYDGGVSSQDTPLDEPVRTQDDARQTTDKGIGSEESTDGTPKLPEPEQAGHDTPTPPEPEQVTHDTATSTEPEQANHDTPLSPEPEQDTLDEGPKGDRGEGSEKRKDRSPSPPASGHKRTYRSPKCYNDSEDDSSGDACGNGGRSGVRANSTHVNPHVNSYDSSYDMNQLRTEMPL